MTISKKLQDGFVAAFTALTVPVMILNILGGIISGIWLAILGEWGEIIRGIIFLVVSSFAISFALMPGLLLAAPAAMAIEKGKKILGVIFGSISMFYTVALITLWCVWVMWLFVSSATERSLLPLLIWSYGVALGPWMWLAQKDQQGGGGNEFSIMTTFFAQISYILAMIMFFMGASFGVIAVIFGIIMIIGAILQMLLAFTAERRQEYQTFSHPMPDDENAIDGLQYLESKEKSSNTKKSAMFYCENCGNQLENNSKFCTKCGAEVIL